MNVQPLLDDVTIWHESHKKANALFSRQLAPDFKLFNLFSINEMTLSQCLAFLLDEKESHGQKDLFIKYFYDLFEVNDDKKLNKNIKENIRLISNNYKVHTEYSIKDGRRIDILLTDNQHFIGIENKPWAGDQKDQLKDYGIWLQEQARNNNENWLLIYLCNGEISEYSLPKNTHESIQQNVLQITFYELLTWLTNCVLYVQAPKVKLFVEALIQYIQEQVNGEIDMTQQEELTKIITSKPDNIRSAILISKNINELKKYLFNKFICHVNQQIGDLKVNVQLDNDIERCYSGFQVKFNENDHFILRWEFQASMLLKLWYGIRRENEKVLFSEEKRLQLENEMKDIITESKPSEWWPVGDWAKKAGMPNSIDENVWIEFTQPENSPFAKSVIEIIRKVYANKELLALLK